MSVVLPEVVVSHWWEQVLHSQSALFFKRLLLFEPGVVVVSVPFHVRGGDGADEPWGPGSELVSEGGFEPPPPVKGTRPST